jgi:hypothetical protein
MRSRVLVLLVGGIVALAGPEAGDAMGISPAT